MANHYLSETKHGHISVHENNLPTLNTIVEFASLSFGSDEAFGLNSSTPLIDEGNFPSFRTLHFRSQLIFPDLFT